MKRKVVFGAVFLVIIAVCAGSLMRSPQDTASPDSEQGDAEAVLVEVTPAQAGDIDITISETGVTTPDHSITISSEVSGQIVRMPVEVGQNVARGKVIAQIDRELYELDVEQAKAQRINAAATYEKAQKDIERYRILLEREEISEGEFETMRLQHEQARSAFLSAEAALKTAERRLRNTGITSPVSGEIAAKYVQMGNMVSIAEPIVKIVDNSTIKVRISLSELDVVNLRTGMPVDVLIDAFPGKVFKGAVSSVGPEANMNTHTFPVEIKVHNNQGPPIRSGMIARVSIKTGVIKQAVLVPAEAIVERYGKNCVYVVNNGIAVEKEIGTGRTSGNLIQIVDGVRPGDQVLTVGQFNVQDGSPVRINR